MIIDNTFTKDFIMDFATSMGSQATNHQRISTSSGGFWKDSGPGNTTMGLDEMDREFASNSSGMMGEVMNLEDFLDELSEPDPKLVNNNETTSAPPSSSTSENTNRSSTSSSSSTNRYMYNPLANLEVMFNSSNYYQLQNQQIQHSSMISKNESHKLKENSNDNNGISAMPIHQSLSSSMILADPTSPNSYLRKRRQSIGGDPSSSTGSSETSNAASFILQPEAGPASASSASMMHQDLSFDPTTRIFTDDELRPQPILRKRKKQYVADEQKTEKYWEKRAKNNNAARRSREAKRTRENQILLRARFLEDENARLREEMKSSFAEKASMQETIHRLNQRLQHFTSNDHTKAPTTSTSSSSSNSEVRQSTLFS